MLDEILILNLKDFSNALHFGIRAYLITYSASVNWNS